MSPNLPDELIVLIGNYMSNSVLLHTSKATPVLFDLLAPQIRQRRTNVKRTAYQIYDSLPNSLKDKVSLDRITQFGHRYPVTSLLDFMKRYKNLPYKEQNTIALAMLPMIDPHRPIRAKPPLYHIAANYVKDNHSADAAMNAHLLPDFLIIPAWYCFFIPLLRSHLQKDQANPVIDILGFYFFTLFKLMHDVYLHVYNRANANPVANLKIAIDEFIPDNKQEKEYLSILETAYQDIIDAKSNTLITQLEQDKRCERRLGMVDLVISTPPFLYAAHILGPLALTVLGSPLFYCDSMALDLKVLIPNRLRESLSESDRYAPRVEALMLISLRCLLYAAVFMNATALFDKYLKEPDDCTGRFCPQNKYSVLLALGLAGLWTLMSTYLYERARPHVTQVGNTLHHAYRSLRAPRNTVQDIEAATYDPKTNSCAKPT